MPTVAPQLSPSLTDVDVLRFPFIRWPADSPQAQGVDGQHILEAAEQVFCHWNERAESLLATVVDADECSYVSVPPNRAFYVKTRYRFHGKGEPLAFDLHEEE